MNQTAVDILKHSDRYLRNVAVDNVIFGYHDKELKVLLQQPINVDKWTVTGGYIERTESIEEAAHRNITPFIVVAIQRTGAPDKRSITRESADHVDRFSRVGINVEAALVAIAQRN